jgi:hypothetical protein
MRRILNECIVFEEGEKLRGWTGRMHEQLQGGGKSGRVYSI